jgi:GT2 family glycosyltransferase
VVDQLRDADHRAEEGRGVSAPPPPDVSIVVVSFNTREVLEETLAAVDDDTAGVSAELIVVDNASRDGSPELVRARFPKAALIENPENRYYSAANNQGLAAGRGRYLLVLNSDAAPRRGTIPAMIRYMDRHTDVGALSPRMEFPDGRVQRNCARRRPYAQFLYEYTLLGLLRPGARRACLDRCWYGDWDRLTERDVDVLPGSCLMVRRDAIERAGRLDERLLLYFTEDDWCDRLQQAGFRVVYAPIGAVVHPESTSVALVRREARGIYFDDMIRYVGKHFGRTRAIWLLVLSKPTRWLLDLSGLVRGERRAAHGNRT